MAEVPLSWKLSISGAEDVKSKLQDIQNQFQRGGISSTEYAKGLREVNRDARTLTRQSDIQKNVFLAQYPAINQLSRGLSAFNSVASSGLSIMNSLNLMFLRQGQDTTALSQLEAERARIMRDMNKAATEGDWSKYEELKSELMGVDNQIISMKKHMDETRWNDQITGVLGFGAAIGMMMTPLLKILPYLGGLRGSLIDLKILAGQSGIFSGMSKGILGLLGPIAIVAAALYGVTEILGILMPKEFKELLDRIKKEYNVDDLTAHLIAPFEIWKIGILELIIPAIVDGINGLIDLLNSINPLKGITGAIPKINYTKPQDPLDVTGQYLAENFGAGSKGLAGQSIPRGEQEIIGQQKTTNEFAEITAEEAKRIAETWLNQTQPILQESRGEQKTSVKVLQDSYTTAQAQLSLTAQASVDQIEQLQQLNKTASSSFGFNGPQRVLFPGSAPDSALGTALAGLGNPGNLSGSQIINALHRASGFEGYVNTPTPMIVGEAGGEYVSVTPHGRSGKNDNVTINVYGSVWSERELMRVVNDRLKSDFQGRNWTNYG